MPHGIYTETDIPAEDVDLVVKLLKAEPEKPAKVEKIRQPNGKYTVIATWPEGTSTDED